MTHFDDDWGDENGKNNDVVDDCNQDSENYLGGCECLDVGCDDNNNTDNNTDICTEENKKEEDCAKLDAANEVYDDNQPTYDGQFSDQSHLQSNVGGNWNLADVSGIAGLELANTDNGFSSRLYSRTVDGQLQFMYVTEGTDFDLSNDGNISETIADIVADIEQIYGHSEQYNLSLRNAKLIDKYVKSIPGASLIFVGHSLGGGQASYNSLGTGWDAYTYNPAGLSAETLNTLTNLFDSTIEATVVDGEIVSHLQDYFSGIKSLEIQGNITKLNNPSSDWIKVLDNLSKTSGAAQVAELYLRIKSHMVDALKKAMNCP